MIMNRLSYFLECLYGCGDLIKVTKKFVDMVMEGFIF